MFGVFWRITNLGSSSDFVQLLNMHLIFNSIVNSSGLKKVRIKDFSRERVPRTKGAPTLSNFHFSEKNRSIGCMHLTILLNIGYVSNETNTDVRMYTL